MNEIDGMQEGNAIHLQDGDVISYEIKKGYGVSFAFCCCDCGLIHDTFIDNQGEKIKIILHRNDKLTEDFRHRATRLRCKLLKSYKVEKELTEEDRKLLDTHGVCW